MSVDRTGHPTAWTGVAKLLAGVCVLAGLYFTSLHNYLLFHTLVELASVIVAAGVFIVFWNTRRLLKNRYFLFLGVAWVFVATLDLFHVLSYKGMGVIPDETANTPTQLWIAARYLEAFSLLLAPLFLRRKLNVILLMATYAGIVAVILASIFYWRVFPQCFQDGAGLTSFKVVSEYVICLVLLGAIVPLIWYRHDFDPPVLKMLIAAVVITIVSELAFTFYISVYGFSNFVGHILKVVAYYFIYKAIIEASLRKPYSVLFRELQEHERSLVEKDERLLQALQVGRSFAFEWDAVTDRVTRSAHCAEILGVAGDEITSDLGQSFFQRVHPEDRERFVGTLDALTPAANVYNATYRIIRPDGRIVFLEEMARGEFNDAGKLVRLIGMSSDATARKQVEEELKSARIAAERAKEEAEAANRSKGEFLANISHDLRTPISAILGMIDVALPKASDPMLKDCLHTARGSADLLLTLLNDLLDTSKIEAGKLDIEAAPFSLRSTLDQITRVLAVRASEKGLCFYCRMAEEIPDIFIGDRVRLQQILMNLASNAIKFTQHGEVEIRVDALGLDEEAHLRFIVRDTGIGISASARQRLFNPFVQAERSTTRRFGGTGLGLSICKSLVELMGGQIGVESEVGKGSAFSFTVRLPLGKELPADTEGPAVSSTAASRLSLLLVEDNPANRKLAAYILQDRGHSVEIAENGHEALSRIAHNRYDVILMDVQMPGMNGLEATAAIRERESGGSRVPIIAMTAGVMKEDRERCFAAGVDGYLPKPINPQQMIGLVESLARNVASGTDGSFAISSPAAAPASAEPRIFDLETAIARCFEREDMARKMIRSFFRDMDTLLPQMQEALDEEDILQVARLGHRIKGTLVYIGAEPAAQAAHRVEQLRDSNETNPARARDAITSLMHECELLRAVLIDHPIVTGKPKPK